jgi:amino acid transporter
MTDRPVTAIPGTTEAPPARLEPDAIGAAQDTVIGLASSAPAATAGVTLASLALVAAYGGGPILILCGVPMLILANCYRRLNLWNANCGAAFEWVGRAINPYLGYMTGWFMITAYIFAGVTGVEVLGPSVLAIFNNSGGKWADIGIAVAVTLVMLTIAVVGIRITARTQVSMGVIEYTILVGFAIAGLVLVLGHHPGTFPITKGWFSLTGIGGKGSLAPALVLAVFVYSGWDGTVYVNEEVRHRRTNPGRAAVVATLILIVMYTLTQVGLQGTVSPSKLQANSASALVYTAQAIGGSGWAKVMAFALALSVIALTSVTIVLVARIIYGMASYRALPEFLGNVSRRYSTPVAASVLVAALVIGITIVYLLATSIQGAFNDVVVLSGVLYALFYVLTALATIVYYRRRVFSNAWDAVLVGILPFAAAGFLVWILEQYLASAPKAQQWSLVGVVGVGVVLMLIARFVLRSHFFQIRRETGSKERIVV